MKPRFWESNMQWADLAFSEHEIPAPLRDTGKEVLEHYLGKRVLFFFLARTPHYTGKLGPMQPTPVHQLPGAVR